MRGFVRARMSLEIVRFNTLLLWGARDKEAYIRQRPNMAYGGVMELLIPWREKGTHMLEIRADGIRERKSETGK